MKKILASIILCGIASGHVPVITPTGRPHGDVPPKLEEQPLPPIMFNSVYTNIPIIIWTNSTYTKSLNLAN